MGNLNDSINKNERMLTEDLRPLNWAQWEAEVISEAKLTPKQIKKFKTSENMNWLKGLYNSGLSVRDGADKLRSIAS